MCSCRKPYKSVIFIVLSLSCCSHFDQSQHLNDLVVMLILYSHQKGTQVVIKQSSGSCRAVIRLLSGSCQAVVRLSSGNGQVDVKNRKYWPFIVQSMGLKDFPVLLFYFCYLNSDEYMTELQFTAN